MLISLSREDRERIRGAIAEAINEIRRAFQEEGYAIEGDEREYYEAELNKFRDLRERISQ